MNMKNEKTYSIGTVARMTGVPKYKLRDWCDRHLKHIERISVGRSSHRRFKEEDILIIEKMKRLIADGSTLRSAAAKAMAESRKEKENDQDQFFRWSITAFAPGNGNGYLRGMCCSAGFLCGRSWTDVVHRLSIGSVRLLILFR